MPHVFVVVITLALATLPAPAADMNYCRPYARDLTQVLVNYIWKRAYSNCLNVEGKDPVVPDNWQSAWLVVEPVAVTPVDLSKVGVVPATDNPKPKRKYIISDPLPDDPPVDVAPDSVKVASVTKAVAVTKSVTSVGKGRSGYAKGTAQWNSYCKRYWPASFDAKTGTIIKRGHRRIPCPA